MHDLILAHPTLEEYHSRVRVMANKYGMENWFELNPDEMEFEDRFEFSFITAAVGDQLIQREFFEMSVTPEGERSDKNVIGVVEEPGTIPGSLLWGSHRWMQKATLN